MRLTQKNTFHRQQQGMVLIVCLIMLAVLTALGVHTMTMATMEGQMSSNSQTMMSTFQSAESAVAGTLAEDTIFVDAINASPDGGQSATEAPPEDATPAEVAAWEAAAEAASIDRDFEMGTFNASTMTRLTGPAQNMEGNSLNTFVGYPFTVISSADQPATGARTRITQGVKHLAPGS